MRPKTHEKTRLINFKWVWSIEYLKTLEKRRKWSVSRTKGFNVVFEGSLVLEVRTTGAEPALATILLVGSPVTFHGQQLPALATRKRLHPVLPLVMVLQRSEVFQRLRSRVAYVVLAPFCATVAWNVA